MEENRIKMPNVIEANWKNLRGISKLKNMQRICKKKNTVLTRTNEKSKIKNLKTKIYRANTKTTNLSPHMAMLKIRKINTTK